MNSYLLLCIGEQLPDVLFRRTDILAQDFRPIDDLGLACIEHLANLPCYQGLARTRRAVEQKA